MKYSKGREDYLEAIYVLSEKSGFARTKDIADFLSVKLPSVSEVVQKLAVEGFVEHTPYGEIILTEKGKEIGEGIWDKHQLIFSFLRDVLKVEPTDAFKEACLIEHTVSKETLKKLEEFVKEYREK